MRTISKGRLTEELGALGLRAGARVMMHSSLSALGPVEGGAETVVDALLDTIGREGTLLVPAFRDSVWGDPAHFTNSDCRDVCPRDLCPSKQPGYQGIIPETLRRREGTLRSCHPTHSWAALGPDAERLLSGHRKAATNCGSGNPFEELVELDGCVLILGVQVNTITLWHHYEETLPLDYMGHYWPKERHLNNCVPGLRIQYEYPGLMQDVCRAAGILTTGPVGKSTSGVMRARDFDSFMATIHADDPYCMVLRPPERDNADLAVDALRKAARMVEAWRRGPARPTGSFDALPHPIQVPDADALVREDCPAFAGYHDANGKRVPLCRANGIHPETFRLGGLFGKHGVTTCGTCVWNRTFPMV
jgi:aminoglycoside 3-N-acetyltransferase